MMVVVATIDGGDEMTIMTIMTIWEVGNEQRDMDGGGGQGQVQ